MTELRQRMDDAMVLRGFALRTRETYLACVSALAEVLATCGPAYLATHALSAAQAKVWRAIVACRTAALGGHVDRCDACGVIRHVYHSCRNRHCPQCQTRAKEAWLAARQRELLPVPYFHHRG